MNKENVYGMEYYSALKNKKEICDNMDQTRVHYAKWNKPAIKGQILNGM